MAIDPLSGIRGAIATYCQTPEDKDDMAKALLGWLPTQICWGLNLEDLDLVAKFADVVRQARRREQKETEKLG